MLCARCKFFQTINNKSSDDLLLDDNAEEYGTCKRIGFDKNSFLNGNMNGIEIKIINNIPFWFGKNYGCAMYKRFNIMESNDNTYED